jgi:hypothetical protein
LPNPQPTPKPPTPPTPAPAACMPFLSSLNNTNCNKSNFKREKSAETSVEACRNWCCNANSSCNAWEWHANAGGQCYISPLMIDPLGCKPMSDTLQWIGESRKPAPPPVPPAPAVARKRGYSGFLGANFTCEDAQALNLKDSW